MAFFSPLGPDIVIGVPSTSPGDLCQKLHEERMRYLVAELDIKVCYLIVREVICFE